VKFLQNKHIIVGTIFIIFFATGVYFQVTKTPWVTLPKNLTTQTEENQNDNKRIFYNGKYYNIVKQKTFSKNQYSSPQMNISFIFPTNIKFKQITPQLIALYDPAKQNNDDNTLYIYSTTVPENSIEFKIPFTIPGSLKQTKIIKTRTFTANQETYSDGKSKLTLLVLRQKDQTIVIRIPPNPDMVSETITYIMNSIKTLQ